jgi:hypothetical protein
MYIYSGGYINITCKIISTDLYNKLEKNEISLSTVENNFMNYRNDF